MPKIRSISPVREQTSILTILDKALEGGPELIGQKPYERLKEEVRNVRYGWQHETNVEKAIVKHWGKSNGGVLLNGVILPFENGYFEIDHLLINKFGSVAIVESKSYGKDGKVSVNSAGEWEFTLKSFDRRIDSPVEQALEAKRKLLWFLKNRVADRYPFQIGAELITVMVVIPNDTKFDPGNNKLPVVRLEAIGNRAKINAILDGQIPVVPGVKELGTLVMLTPALIRHAFGVEDDNSTPSLAAKVIKSMARPPSADFYLKKARVRQKTIDAILADAEVPSDPSVSLPKHSAAPTKPQVASFTHSGCEFKGCTRILSDKQVAWLRERKEFGGRLYCAAHQREVRAARKGALAKSSPA